MCPSISPPTVSGCSTRTKHKHFRDKIGCNRSLFFCPCPISTNNLEYALPLLLVMQLHPILNNQGGLYTLYLYILNG